MIAPTVLTRRTIATQIHLLAKTRRSTGRRYRSTRAITSSVIWTTANTPRATRPHTGTEDNNESITYALSPSCLAHHANADGARQLGERAYVMDSLLSSVPVWGLVALGLSLIHISEPTRRTPISYAVFCL